MKFTFNEKEFYIDGRLKEQLDTKVLPNLQKKDKDFVFCIDGAEGSGKSKFADIIGAYISSKLETPYDLSCLCMTPEEFRDKIKDCPKKSVVIYDEAHRGMGSRRALSEVNNLLIDLMMEMRQKNLCVIVVLPTIFMLDRYVALFRTNGLFHIYERKGQRGFWVYFNRKHKLNLYINGKKLFNYNCMAYPKFRGRFYNQYAVDEEEYRLKKKKAFEDKPRITKAEKYIYQRNLALYAIQQINGFNAKEVHKEVKRFKIDLDYPTIAAILVQIAEEFKENTENLVKSVKK